MNILDINEFNDHRIKRQDLSLYGTFDGIQIKTDNQDILILIDSAQSCCESFGYISSLDDFDDFIGAEIIDVALTNDALETTKLELENIRVDLDSCYFVNVNTSKGLLQFTLYNQHNGYYAHNVKVIVGNEYILEGGL